MANTLASIEQIEGDQAIVVSNGEDIGAARMFHKSGLNGVFVEGPERLKGKPFPPRNIGMAQATASHIAHMDDDDEYVAGAFGIIRRALNANPDAAHVFKMKFPNGSVQWREKKISTNSRGTPLLFVRNDERVAQWRRRSHNNYDYMSRTTSKYNHVIWHNDIIVMVNPHGTA